MRVFVVLLLATQPDLSGTWVLNTAKSQSSQLPAARTLIVQRSANGYVFHQHDGTDSTTYAIALGGAAPAADLGDGASNLKYTAQVVGDTIVYVADVTVDNQGLVGTQTGKLFLSADRKVLTDVNELVSSGEAIQQRLVFDRKR